jgi:hypothetical protein
MIPENETSANSVLVVGRNIVEGMVVSTELPELLP